MLVVTRRPAVRPSLGSPASLTSIPRRCGGGCGGPRRPRRARANSYDNAAAKAFNSTLKSELNRNRHVLADKGPWRSIDDLEIAVAEGIEWYNTTRLHGSLNDVPPIEYEITYHADHAPSRPVGATP
jgi:hypothetical protein